MKKIITILAVLATLLGGLAAAAPAQAATTWDCDTTGVAQCTGTLGGIGDAWETFDAQDPAVDYHSATEPRDLKYYKTYTNVYPSYPAGSAIVLKSVNIPHTWHVFVYFTA